MNEYKIEESDEASGSRTHSWLDFNEVLDDLIHKLSVLCRRFGGSRSHPAAQVN
jgi:hypothetical protein